MFTLFYLFAHAIGNIRFTLWSPFSPLRTVLTFRLTVCLWILEIDRWHSMKQQHWFTDCNKWTVCDRSYSFCNPQIIRLFVYSFCALRSIFRGPLVPFVLDLGLHLSCTAVFSHSCLVILGVTTDVLPVFSQYTVHGCQLATILTLLPVTDQAICQREQKKNLKYLRSKMVPTHINLWWGTHGNNPSIDQW